MRGPFQNPTFRRLFAGRVVTNVGDSFYFVAAMWLVYELTGSAVYSGLAGFLTLAPSALQFLAGPVVDRWPVRRTLTATQVVQAVVVSLVPVVHLAGLLTVETVLVVMPLLAALNQLVYPAQSAALPRLLDDEDLVAANSAFSIAYQGVEMVANGLGGVLIGLVGAVALFAVDAVTFLLAALLFATIAVPAPGERADESMPGDATDTAAEGTSDGAVATDDRAVTTDGGSATGDTATADADANVGDDADPEVDADSHTDPEVDADAHADADIDADAHADPEVNADSHTDPEVDAAADADESYLDRLRTGVDFVRGTVLLWLVAGAAVANFASGMVLASMPAYADSLGMPARLAPVGQAGAYGVLMMAFAAGSLLGAVAASRLDGRPFGRTMVVAFAAAGVLWTAALLVDWLPATALLVGFAAVPVGAVNVQLSAVAQSAPPESYVGRVSSVLGSATSVSVPVGSLVGGVVASATTPRAAMLGFGVASLGLSIYVLVLPGLRGLPAPAQVALRSGSG